MNKKAFLTTLPDFIEIQRASFFWFLEKGLIAELGKLTLISNSWSNIELNFFGHEYKIRKPKYNIRESKFRDTTYAIRLYVPMLINYIQNFDFILRKKVKTYVFIGELPLMTNRGTFIINGCERVILNQIIRSPGVYYDKIGVYSATLIPNRGSWLKLEIGIEKGLTISVDKSEKIPFLDFLHILDLALSDILKNFRHPEFLKMDVLKEKFLILNITILEALVVTNLICVLILIYLKI
jgi:DNA-directed RNA polymerase subunit beta